MPEPWPHHPPEQTDPGYGKLDLWLDTADADDSRARELATLLELRARHPEQVAAGAAYLDLVGVAAGGRVLEVGCGSGAVTRAAARLVGPSGQVVGLDPSPGLLAVACASPAPAAASASSTSTATASSSPIPTGR